MDGISLEPCLCCIPSEADFKNTREYFVFRGLLTEKSVSAKTSMCGCVGDGQCLGILRDWHGVCGSACEISELNALILKKGRVKTDCRSNDSI